MPATLLSGRIAIVTGAESGIGAASVTALAAAGADVVINFLSDRKAAGRVAEAAIKMGVRAAVKQADVGKEQDVIDLFASCTSELGSPTILVNSAGRNGQGVHVADMPLTQWSETLRVNLTSAFLCSRELIRERRGKNGTSSIINISSIHEDIPVPGFADYDASKAGMLALTRTLSLEAAATGIAVNSIAPGMILTPMNEEAEENVSVREEKTQHIPLRRAGKPEEVAALVVYLCTKDAGYITGASVRIDGGLSLRTGQGA